MHGNGKFTWPTGSVFDGYWEANKKTGKGKMICKKDGRVISEYDGMWKDDKRHGEGVMTWYTNDGPATYHGNWVDDVK